MLRANERVGKVERTKGRGKYSGESGREIYRDRERKRERENNREGKKRRIDVETNVNEKECFSYVESSHLRSFGLFFWFNAFKLLELK